MGPFERTYVENFGMKTCPQTLIPCPQHVPALALLPQNEFVVSSEGSIGSDFSLIVTRYGTGCGFAVSRIRTAMRDICSKSG